MFIHKTGDVLSTGMHAIGHGVNVMGDMSGGVAAVIAREFPALLPPYKEACRSGALAVGGLQAVKVRGRPELTILNLASQDRPGRHARAGWLEESLNAAVAYAQGNGLAGFALPRVGAGIGGLDWESEAKPLIEDIADAAEELTIEIWSLPGADTPSLMQRLLSCRFLPG